MVVLDSLPCQPEARSAAKALQHILLLCEVPLHLLQVGLAPLCILLRLSFLQKVVDQWVTRAVALPLASKPRKLGPAFE